MEAVSGIIEIVMYHYVKDRDRSGHETHLTLKEFQQQLDYFSSNGKIIHPQELDHPETDPQSVGRRFLLSFDDGLLDHYTVVYPELQRRGLAGLFFVHDPAFRTNRLLNVHRLHALLQYLPDTEWIDEAFQLAEAFPLLEHVRTLFDRVGYQGLQEEEKIKRLKVLLNFCLRFEDQESILQQLINSSALDEKALSLEWYLQDDMVLEMHQAGMVFGAHGSSHYLLSNWPIQRQQADIAASLSWLRGLIPEISPWFCYPYGYREAYTQETMDLLQQLNVTTAFEVENRWYDTDQKISRLQIPRIDCVHFPPKSN